MKSVFDKTTRDELVKRIESLNEHSKAQWGKMNVYQMLKHCVLCEEMYLGNKNYKRVFLGRLFGRMALKSLLKDETPLKPGAPTGEPFKIKETAGDLTAEKNKWITLMQQYGSYSNDHYVHWFFGNMTREQVGWFAYKHTDHHLRQFNV